MDNRQNLPEIIHASCVSVGPCGVLIIGPSASGKSALALELMSLGAVLVADDRTIVEQFQDRVRASCPAAIRGSIEARGVGLLQAEFLPHTFLRLVVDLGTPETQRLPPEREYKLIGQSIALLHDPVHGHFPAAILQYLKGGRTA